MKDDYNEMLESIVDQKERDVAMLYSKDYWLTEPDYTTKWLAIQESIFTHGAKHLPDLMFKKTFELFPLVGGDIFTIQKDFELLKDCMCQIGDKKWVVIQNQNVVVKVYWRENDFRVQPFTRFEYPVDISWDELNSGGIIGCEHLTNGCKDYFVFGDSGAWGRYVANSWIQPTNLTGLNPLNIMGFKKEYADIFKSRFEGLRREEPEITPDILFSEWLPENYRNLKNIS